MTRCLDGVFLDALTRALTFRFVTIPRDLPAGFLMVARRPLNGAHESWDRRSWKYR